MILYRNLLYVSLQCQSLHVGVGFRRFVSPRPFFSLWPLGYVPTKTVRIFFWLYLRPNPFREVRICPYPSLDIQHPIPYLYPNTQITYLWCRYQIISYPAWFTLSVFESESEQKKKNKCNISYIRLYPICFHPQGYALTRVCRCAHALVHLRMIHVVALFLFLSWSMHLDRTTWT